MFAFAKPCPSNYPSQNTSDIRLCVKSRLHTKILFISLDLKPSPCTLRRGFKLAQQSQNHRLNSSAVNQTADLL
ncbi:Hypothetical predicted protein [Scomber scombrus]|uniref:Uncharacterized protein n=1 Tax=Scomber scombrus TaxID=13677 RepID=A0AAV1PM67_SCOSC